MTKHETKPFCLKQLQETRMPLLDWRLKIEKSNTQSKLFLQTSYDKAWDKAILSQAIARN